MTMPTLSKSSANVRDETVKISLSPRLTANCFASSIFPEFVWHWYHIAMHPGHIPYIHHKILQPLYSIHLKCSCCCAMECKLNA